MMSTNNSWEKSEPKRSGFWYRNTTSKIPNHHRQNTTNTKISGIKWINHSIWLRYSVFGIVANNKRTWLLKVNDWIEGKKNAFTVRNSHIYLAVSMRFYCILLAKNRHFGLQLRSTLPYLSFVYSVIVERGFFSPSSYCQLFWPPWSSSSSSSLCLCRVHFACGTRSPLYKMAVEAQQTFYFFTIYFCTEWIRRVLSIERQKMGKKCKRTIVNFYFHFKSVIQVDFS